MILRRTFRGTIVFQTATGSTNAEPAQVEQVIMFPYELFPAVWEWDGTDFFTIDPVKGWYEKTVISEQQLEWLNDLKAVHNDIAEVEGVVKEEW